jgi:hypothetical protein
MVYKVIMNTSEILCSFFQDHTNRLHASDREPTVVIFAVLSFDGMPGFRLVLRVTRARTSSILVICTDRAAGPGAVRLSSIGLGPAATGRALVPSSDFVVMGRDNGERQLGLEEQDTGWREAVWQIFLSGTEIDCEPMNVDVYAHFASG